MLTNGLDAATVAKFVTAIGTLMQFKASPPNDQRRVTIMFSYAPTGWMDESILAATTADEDVDVIHLEFDTGGETEGPANIQLSEDRNGTILTWPQCDLWADRDPRIFLLVPRGQDFGFAIDGGALVRVTDLDTGPERALGIARARTLLTSAVAKIPTPRRK